MKKKVAIIGSGIAGLTLANLLRMNLNSEFAVYEKEDNLKMFSSSYQPAKNGRPKGSLNRSTIAKRWLDTLENIKNPMSGEMQFLTQEDIIM